jgi:predicted nucleic acid-binding Zn ribbon protein
MNDYSSLMSLIPKAQWRRNSVKTSEGFTYSDALREGKFLVARAITEGVAKEGWMSPIDYECLNEEKSQRKLLPVNLAPRTCIWDKCGKEFTPANHRNSPYCSQLCRLDRKNEIAKQRRAGLTVESFIEPRPCVVCEKTFTPNAQGSRTVCSQDCTIERNRARARELSRQKSANNRRINNFLAA